MIKKTGSIFRMSASAGLLGLMLCLTPGVYAATEAERALIERHLIPFEGGRNFRDLGGYQTMDGRTIKTGKLFR